MRTLEDIVSEQQRARAADDPVAELLMTELVRVAEELCVMRDRLDTCLRLAGESVDEASIDAYEVSADLTEQRLARHQSFFEDLFGRLASGSP